MIFMNRFDWTKSAGPEPLSQEQKEKQKEQQKEKRKRQKEKVWLKSWKIMQ